MSRNRRAAPGLAALFAIVLALSPAFAAAQSRQVPTYTVTDAPSLIENIGSNRTVVLKKGDYLLSAAYGIETDFVSWYEGEDGRELELSDLENLTIRGSEGARIVCDAADASVLSLYSSKNVTFDNLRFVRAVGKDDYVGGGGLYAEGAVNLVVDRCTIEGPQSFGLELWSCPGAVVKRTDISQADSSAIIAYFSDGLGISQSKVHDCEGFPLVSIQDSDNVSIADTAFTSNYGGILVEIYREGGYADSVGFEGCSFVDNDFEYFSGQDILPYTNECGFDGNSFDDSWEENSVAPSEEDYYYGDEYAYDEGVVEDEGGFEFLYDDLQYYEHAASGLSFFYPGGWELETSTDESRFAIYSPGGEALVLVLTAFAPPGGLDPAALDKTLFSEALSKLVATLELESGVKLEVEGEGSPYTDFDLTMTEFKGQAVKKDGGNARARVRLIASAEAVQALVLLGRDEASIDEDSEAETILNSIDLL
jgi:hypothetical protein